MALVLNKMGYVNQKGIVKNAEYAQTYNCLVYAADGVTAIVPGDCVKIKSVAGATGIVVEKVAADTDIVFGMVPYEPARKNSYFLNDMVTIAGEHSLIVCEASAAITAGANVMSVLSGQKVATATTGKAIVGMALTPAAAAGDLITVRLEKSALSA